MDLAEENFENGPILKSSFRDLSALVRNYGDVFDEADKPFSREFFQITRHHNYENP